MPETLDFSIYVRRDGGRAHMDLALEGVGCAGCIRKIEHGLKQLPGILDARLNFTTRRLAVDWRRVRSTPATSSTRSSGSATALIRSSRNMWKPRRRGRRACSCAASRSPASPP